MAGRIYRNEIRQTVVALLGMTPNNFGHEVNSNMMLLTLKSTRTFLLTLAAFAL